MKLHLYYVYVLSSGNKNAIYIGVTSDLAGRVFQHKKKLFRGFTSKYNIDKLVYFECFDHIDLAIAREKQIKGYSRAKKDALINEFNPDWSDLYKNGKIVTP